MTKKVNKNKFSFVALIFAFLVFAFNFMPLTNVVLSDSNDFEKTSSFVSDERVSIVEDESFSFDYQANVISKPSSPKVDSNGFSYDFLYDVLNCNYSFVINQDLSLSVTQSTKRGTIISGTTPNDIVFISDIYPGVVNSIGSIPSVFSLSSENVYSKGNFAVTNDNNFAVTTLLNYQNSVGKASYRYYQIGNFALNETTYVEIQSFVVDDGFPSYKRFIFIEDYNSYLDGLSSNLLVLDVSFYSFDEHVDSYFIGDFEKIYQSAYDDGVSFGQNLATNVFYGSTVSGTIVYEGFNGTTNSGTSYTLNIVDEPLLYTKYGVSFKSFSNKYASFVIDDIYYYFDYADLTLDFYLPFVYNNYFEFYYQGDSLFTYNNFDFVSDGGTSYEFTFEETNSNVGDYKLKPLTNSVLNKTIVKLDDIQVKSNDILHDLVLLSYSNVYKSAYDEGYDSGFSDGEVKGDRLEYDKGYDEGYDNGYSDGVDDSDSYPEFYSLISAVIDVPISVITDFLNFEVLGVNLNSVFSSLISVSLVIFFIRLFTGG